MTLNIEIEPAADLRDRDLRARGRMFDAAFQAAVIGKAIVDVGGCCIEVNGAFAAMLGYTRDELAGVHFTSFTHPEDIDVDVHLFDETMRGERDGYTLDKRYLRKDGSSFPILLCATVIRGDDGAPLQFISEVLDMTERNEARAALEEVNERLRRQVVTDHLTGLYNRRGYEEAVAALPDEGSASLLLIDLDGFKRINDRLGHDAGDLVLAEVGRRLRLQVRSGDFIARLGGDEFAVILHDGGREIAEQVASRIVDRLAWPYEVGTTVASLGASVGVSCANARRVTLRDLAVEADRALYAAKRSGRSRWRMAA